MNKCFVGILIGYLAVLLWLQGRFVYNGGEPLHLWASVFLEVTAALSLFGLRSGIRQFRSVRTVQKTGIPGKAVIQGFHVEYDRMKTYYPIIRFRDADGVTNTCQSRVGMSIIPRKYRKGSQVSIVYPAQQPEQFVILPAYCYQSLIAFSMWSFFGIPSVIGSFMLLI